MEIIDKTQDDSDKVLRELEKYNNNKIASPVNYKPFTFHAEIDGEFAGGINGYTAWNTMEISNIIALKTGQGIGGKLLQKAESYARENGVNKIVLSTMEFQAPGFYEKFGFTQFAMVEGYAESYNSYYYIKKLI